MDRLADKHILVTGGGAPGAAGIIKALKEHSTAKISSCDIREDVVGQILADDFFTVLPGDHPEYIEKLRTRIQDKNIDLILPITTRELFSLSRNRDLFKDLGISVVVSPFESLSIANDKGKLLNHLKHNGLPCPKYSIAQNKDEALDLLDEFYSSHSSFVFKPCISNGSRGFRMIRKAWDAKDKLLNQKPGTAQITFDQASQMLESIDELPPFVFMEELPGDEYSVDCLVHDGDALIVPRKRSRINNGISVEGVVTKNEAVISYCQSILQSLELEGPIGIQVKMNANNQPMLLEINPRLQGTSVACIGAGLNIPVLACEIALGFTTDLKEVEKKIKWETKFVRYYMEAYLHG